MILLSFGVAEANKMLFVIILFLLSKISSSFFFNIFFGMSKVAVKHTPSSTLTIAFEIRVVYQNTISHYYFCKEICSNIL